MKEDFDRGPFRTEDSPGPDQLLGADVAFGGRFELTKVVDLDVPAQED